MNNVNNVAKTMIEFVIKNYVLLIFCLKTCYFLSVFVCVCVCVCVGLNHSFLAPDF